MKLVSIFGNVGVGKSTLLQSLDQIPNFHVFLEPQEYWDPFFRLYMENPTEWGAAFQVIVLKGFQELYTTIMAKEYNKDDIVVIERSPECSRSFYKWLLLQNHITDKQCEAIDNYANTIQWFQHVEYVYLKADPSICAQRAQSRASELNSCPDDYMTFLSNEWDKRDKTHVIDASLSPSEVLSAFVSLYLKY